MDRFSREVTVDFFNWSHAARMAAQTPAQRNRYVDFLRAASICFVVTGHWLALAVYVEIPVPRHAPWWGHAISRGKSRGQVLLWYLMEHVVG